MARAGYYNDNLYRAYPFLTRTRPLEDTLNAPRVYLPHEAIVDFGAIMDLDAAFDFEDGDTVYLHSIARDGNQLQYDIRTTATGAATTRLLFTRGVLTDPEFTSEWVEAAVAADSSSSSSAAGCVEAPWRGFLVTGRYADVLDLVADGETVYFGEDLWQVEPARIQNLRGTYARSINLGNFDRTHVRPAAGCDPPSEAATEIFVSATCLQGPLAVKEGYNTTIRQELANNALVIGAAVGAGAGTACAEIPLYDGEVAPADSPFLSGGPGCGDVVKTVNGKGGRRLTIKAGPGFRVIGDSDNPNTLVIDRQLQDFALCLGDDDSASSLSSSSIAAED